MSVSQYLNRMIYITSDHHLMHKNIIQYCLRPFSSVEEMDQVLIENWNKTISPNDEVLLLGDLTMANPEPLFGHLNGKKITLVVGNHDRKGPWKRHGYEVVNFMEYTIGRFKVLLCHYPIFKIPTQWDSYIQRKLRPLIDNFDAIICGHVHQLWKTKEKCINVGVDVREFKPISIEEIEKEILILTQDTLKS